MENKIKERNISHPKEYLNRVHLGGKNVIGKA